MFENKDWNRATAKKYLIAAGIFVLVILLAACSPQPAAQILENETAVPTVEQQIQASPTAVAEEPTSPTPETAYTNDAAVSFSGDVLPILESRCLSCHGGERVEEGFSVIGYADVMKGSANGTVVVPGESQNSIMVELIQANKMPKRGPKLTPVQLQTIMDWIDQGAANN